MHSSSLAAGDVGRAALQQRNISRGGRYDAAWRDEVLNRESGCMRSLVASDPRLYWTPADATTGVAGACSAR